MIDVNMNPATQRKISVLVRLVRERRVSLQQLRSAFAVSERTVLRDLHDLREVGKAVGFAIGDRDPAGMVSLTEF